MFTPLTVVSIVDDGEVRTLHLGGVQPLPSYVPGSHLVLDCGGRLNAYSLLDDGILPAVYRVSILRVPAGAGGSVWMHSLSVGDTVQSSLPRSQFAPVSNARHHLLVAAGIGVTPLLSHARAAARWNRPFTLLYRHRAGRAAHLDELREICGDRLEEYADRTGFAERITSALLSQPLGTHLYVCGPAGFTDLVTDLATLAGWPPVRVHTERFSVAALDPGRAFSVQVGDLRIDVPSGTSLLECLEQQGFSVKNRCRQGVCGECRIPVRAGRIEHRDLYLSEAERAEHDAILPCVSRAADDILEVAL